MDDEHRNVAVAPDAPLEIRLDGVPARRPRRVARDDARDPGVRGVARGARPRAERSPAASIRPPARRPWRSASMRALALERRRREPAPPAPPRPREGDDPARRDGRALGSRDRLRRRPRRNDAPQRLLARLLRVERDRRAPHSGSRWARRSPRSSARPDRSCVGFFGEGGANTGRTWESVNFAAVQALPLIAICENNQYAVETYIGRVAAGPSIAERAAGFGLAVGRRSTARTSAPCIARRARGSRARRERRRADVHRGAHLPLPRPQHRRDRELPHRGRGRAAGG